MMETFRTSKEVNLGDTGSAKVLALSEQFGKALNVGANTITEIVGGYMV